MRKAKTGTDLKSLANVQFEPTPMSDEERRAVESRMTDLVLGIRMAFAMLGKTKDEMVVIFEGDAGVKNFETLMAMMQHCRTLAEQAVEMFGTIESRMLVAAAVHGALAGKGEAQPC